MAKVKKKKSKTKGKVRKGKAKKAKAPKKTEASSTVGRRSGLRIGEWFTERFKANYKKHSTDVQIASEATKEFPERGGYTEKDVMRRRSRYNRLEAPARKQLPKYEKGGKVVEAESRTSEVFNKSKKSKKKAKGKSKTKTKKSK